MSWISWDALEKMPELTKEEAGRALDAACSQVIRNLDQFTDHFQKAYSENGFYAPTENVDWTPGFWTGEIWLAYEHTGNEALKKAGELQMASFLKRINEKQDVETHDLGFMYSPSCVAAYKLTGSEVGKKAALLAADHLAERFRTVGNFLQAWGNPGEPKEYRLIIDCLLNLPLLYWASEVTGDSSYADKAKAHIQTAMKCLVRPDHSTYHTHFFDVNTGEPTYGVTHQGNRNGSAWARGQAWGIYGAALSYRYVKNPEYLDLFFEVTDYFIEHLPEDLVPYWDFDFDTGSSEPRDSSASAIAICGILEMCKYLDEEKAAPYLEAADKMLRALMDHCANGDYNKSNGILLHGTYARDSKENTCKNRGVDECNTWGDYFYMEALIRTLKDWNLYW